MSISTLSLAKYETALASMRSRHDAGMGQLALLTSQREAKQADLGAANANIDLWRQTQMLLTKVSDYARRQLVERIEQTVTAALQTVLADDSLRFEIEIGERNKAATAEWRVVNRYANAGAEAVEIANNPEDARGGGIVDVVSLALRLALLELSHPRPEGPIVLDEIGKMVSAEYRENLGYFLKSYAQQTGRQLIMVTHAEELAACGEVTYRVTKNESGVSEVTRV